MARFTVGIKPKERLIDAPEKVEVLHFGQKEDKMTNE